MIVSLASPMAWPAVAQALTVAQLGPRAPKLIAVWPLARLAMAIGMKNGDSRSGPRVALIVICSTSVPEPPRPRADDRARAIGQVAFEALGQAGLGHRLACRDQRELRVAVVAPDLLAIENVRRVEVVHLARDLARDALGSKPDDRGDADSPATRSLPEGGHVVAQRA